MSKWQIVTFVEAANLSEALDLVSIRLQHESDRREFHLDEDHEAMSVILHAGLDLSPDTVEAMTRKTRKKEAV